MIIGCTIMCRLVLITQLMEKCPRYRTPAGDLDGRKERAILRFEFQGRYPKWNSLPETHEFRFPCMIASMERTANVEIAAAT